MQNIRTTFRLEQRTANMSICNSRAGRKSNRQQIQSVVRAGQATFNFES